MIRNSTHIALWIIACMALASASFAESRPKALQWGVNIHGGSSAPERLAAVLSERNLKCVRMDLWGNDPRALERFRNTVNALNARNIRAEAVVFSAFSAGQRRNQDVTADLGEVEQTAYQSTKSQVESTKDLLCDYELQNEVTLYKGILKAGATGQKEEDFDTPCGRLQAAVLRGMSRAVSDVKKTSGRPLRIILGTVNRHWGFLTFMERRGVLFDVIGYHIYPWEEHKPLDVDPWFGQGGPLTQLARFDRPIRINEFNAGEIYSGTGSYLAKPSYENQAGAPVTEAGFRSIDKHLRAIVSQKVAKVEAVLFYEIWDEPRKAPPENRFGLFYDEELRRPKISLLIATSYARGNLSQSEREELRRRGLGLDAKEPIAGTAGKR